MAQVLLVEDNEMNRDMLPRRLERRGYQDYDPKPSACARLLGKIQALLE